MRVREPMINTMPQKHQILVEVLGLQSDLPAVDVSSAPSSSLAPEPRNRALQVGSGSFEGRFRALVPRQDLGCHETGLGLL